MSRRKGLFSVDFLIVVFSFFLIYPVGFSSAEGEPIAIRTLTYHQITSFTENPVVGQGWQHVISDNGNRVVWYTQPNPKRVFVAEVDGSNVREVANMGSDRLSHVDISADGSKVTYIGGPGPSGNQVNSVNADGSSNQVLITLNTLHINTLRITGDSSKIFFNVIANSSVQGSSDPIERGVYMINPDGSGLQQVVGPAHIAGLLGIPESDVGSYSGFSNGPALDVSNDGSRIIFFAENDQTGKAHVFTANSNGTGVTRIFGPAVSGGGVGISANGNKVAFTVNNDGTREGYTANFDGSSLLMIASNEQFTFTDGNGRGDQVSLTVDGSKVIFDGFGHLFNNDGSGVLQLSANTVGSFGKPLIVGSLSKASMTSDGSRVLFSFVSPGSSSQLAVLDINPTSLGEAPSLSDLSSDPQFIVKDGSVQTTISVRTTTSNTVDYVGNVALRNGLRDTKVTRRTFFDDGVSGGDDVAGDAVFTHNNVGVFSDAVVGPRTLRINAEVFSSDGRLHGTAVDYEPFAVVESAPTIDPAPDIKANGFDGPVTPTGDLTVTVALDPGSRSGGNADWWIAVDTPFGWFYFDLFSGWVFAGDSLCDILVTHQGPLFDLAPPFQILNIPASGFTPGTYTFYFGVDMNTNGLLDFFELLFDFVTVTVP